MTDDTDNDAVDNDAAAPKGGEQALIDALRGGKPCIFIYKGEDKQPAEARTLRGEFLGRILRSEIWAEEIGALPRQIGIVGAVITGKLDMADTKTGMTLMIAHSHFDTAINFSRAHFSVLSFMHSDMAGAHMDHITLDSELGLDDVHNTGELTLRSAAIGGQLSCTSKQRQTRFINAGGKAIDAQGAVIKGGIFLRGVRAEGLIDFKSAKIGGQFSAVSTDTYQTQFSNAGGMALNAQRAVIEGSVFLNGVRAEGMIDFVGATIDGQFSTYTASLINPAGRALDLQGATIKSETYLTDMPHPTIGAIDLTEADLARVVIDAHSYPLGPLYLGGTRYRHLDFKGEQPPAGEGWLFSLSDETRRTRIESHRGIVRQSILQAIAENNTTMDGLSAAQRTALAALAALEDRTLRDFDDLSKPVGYWPAFAALSESLCEQVKDEVAPAAIAAEACSLLEKQITAAAARTRVPFAYRQLSKVLDGMGYEGQARDIRVLAAEAHTKRGAAARTRWQSLLYRGWREFLGLTTGYGERLHYAVYWLLALWALGFWVFGGVGANMVPSRERFYLAEAAYSHYRETGQLPEGYPGFSPFIYALDVMLPIVDFAQESHWRPKNTDGTNYLRLYNRLHLGFGWLLSTIGLAGLTGLLKDKREP